MPVKEIAAATSTIHNGNIIEHAGELAGIIIAVIAPFMSILAWFVKRTVGRVERDIDKCCETTENLDDRITDVEKVLVQMGTYHKMNHPGQDIK